MRSDLVAILRAAEAARARSASVAPRVKQFTVAADEISIRRVKVSGKDTIRAQVPVSSIEVDRDGDNFSEDGLKSMEAQIRTGKVPAFPNHGRDEWGFPTYNVEDIIGGWSNPTVDGSQLRAEITFDPTDPRAQIIASKVEAGLPVGWSVGFIVRRSEPMRDKDGNETGGLIFHDVDLLEISAVGIPSNPDGVAAYLAGVAAKGGVGSRQLLAALTDLLPKDVNPMVLETPDTEDQPADPKDAPKPDEGKSLSVDDVKTAVKEAVGEAMKEAGADLGKTIGDAVKGALASKSKEDDEEEEEEDKSKEDDEDEDEEKSASRKPTGKARPKPRGMQVHDDGTKEPEASEATTKEAAPFAF